MEKIILILITSIPIMYQIVELPGVECINIQHIPILLLNVILMFYFYKNKIKLKKETLIIFFILLMAVFVIPFIVYNAAETTFVENLKYTGFYLNFIVMMILVGNYMVGNNYAKVIGSFLIGNTIILITNIIKNTDEIFLSKCINNIIYLFKLLDKKQTIYLGFNYPNIVSLFIIIEIFLLYKFKNSFTNRTIWFNICINLCMSFWMIPLIATGSRTAIIGVITFCIFSVFFWWFLKLKTYTRIIISTVITLVFIILGYVNFNKMIFAESMKIRLRDVNMLFQYLIENNKIITGLGPIENTLSYAETTGIKNTLDNGYIAFGAQYGIIGLGLILAVVGYILYINLKQKNGQNCALIFTFLIYACVENVLFIPRVLMSLLIWIFIINSSTSNICKENNEVQNSHARINRKK